MSTRNQPLSNERNSNLQRGDSLDRAVKNVIVVGSSGHAKIVIDILESEGLYRVVGLVDSFRPIGTELFGYGVVGTSEDVGHLQARGEIDGAIVAIGDNWVRSEIVAALKKIAPDLPFVCAIHPSANLGQDVTVGAGTVIAAGATVNPGAKIGEFCIVNTGASLDHDCVMGDYSSLGPGAVAGGEVRIGTFSVVAISATLIHDVWIGEHVVIGAGATVLRDVGDNVVAVGTPAQVIRSRVPGEPYLGDKAQRMRVRATPDFRAIPESHHVRLFRPSELRWRAYMSQVQHDVFHTPEYHAFSEGNGEGEAWLAVYGSGDRYVLWPYLLRDIKSADRQSSTGLKDIVSVYGYSGPLTFGCADDQAFFASAWQAFQDTWRSQGAISVFTRFHPLLQNQNAAKQAGSSELVAVGQTIAVDLTRSEEEIWSAYKKQLRQAIRRNEELGLTTEVDLEWKYLDDFRRIYSQTMDRNQASSFYLFSEEYFDRLKAALGHRGKLIVTKFRGEVAGALLLIEYDGIATAHLAATDPHFMNVSPSKTYFHYAQLWARKQGNRALHLGGGRGASDRDPLFLFKAQFTGNMPSHPFFVGRWILDADQYHRLSNEHRTSALRLGYSDIDPVYFPAYRAPFISPLQPRSDVDELPAG